MDCIISLWQAIKIRIAGKNYKNLIEDILEEYVREDHVEEEKV